MIIIVMRDIQERNQTMKIKEGEIPGTLGQPHQEDPKQKYRRHSLRNNAMRL